MMPTQPRNAPNWINKTMMMFAMNHFEHMPPVAATATPVLNTNRDKLLHRDEDEILKSNKRDLVMSTSLSIKTNAFCVG